MKHLSETKVELKKSVAYKDKRVHTFSFIFPNFVGFIIKI